MIRSLRECGWMAADGFEQWRDARQVTWKMRGRFYGIKIHTKMYGEVSPWRIYGDLLNMGFHVWDDDKQSDIPSVVAKCVRNIAKGGADLVSIHGGDNLDTLGAAVEAYRKVDLAECVRPIPGFGIVAITPLTSIPPMNVKLVHGKSLEERALEVAKYADMAGAYGVVCSPLEVRGLRSAYPGLKYFTPGIRLQGSSKDDQERVGTPAYALAHGADYLVIGRGILKTADGRGWNPDMLGAVERFEENIASGVD